jgi:hypothetical protein
MKPGYFCFNCADLYVYIYFERSCLTHLVVSTKSSVCPHPVPWGSGATVRRGRMGVNSVLEASVGLTLMHHFSVSFCGVQVLYASIIDHDMEERSEPDERVRQRTSAACDACRTRKVKVRNTWIRADSPPDIASASRRPANQNARSVLSSILSARVCDHAKREGQRIDMYIHCVRASMVVSYPQRRANPNNRVWVS